MTNRFFRNAVGVAALTSLALGLACSGSSDPDPVGPSAGKPATPIVSISGLNSSNQAITKHQYVISVSDPSGQATSFTASGSLGAKLESISGSSAFVYTPQKAGDERISVYSVAGSNKSDAGIVMASVVDNSEPSIISKASIDVGGEMSITLPISDGDGDSVAWANAKSSNATGTATLTDNTLTIKVASTASENDTFNVTVTSTETHPTAKYVVQSVDRTISVTVGAVGAGGGGDDLFDWTQGKGGGQIQSFPNNWDTAPIGVPFIFGFNATNVQGDAIKSWHVNGGLSAWNDEGVNSAPAETWIGQPYQAGIYRRPDIGKLGDAFERWRFATDFTKNRPYGRANNALVNFPGGMLYFVPKDGDEYIPDHYSSKVNIGVRADFNSSVIAYGNFYVSVTKNTEPKFWYNDDESTVADLDLTGEDAITITVLNKRADDPKDEYMPAEVPWATKADGIGEPISGVGIQYEEEPALVFRHENLKQSYDMAASIDLGKVANFYDEDFVKYGDVLTFMLDGVTYGDNRTAASGGTNTLPWATFNPNTGALVAAQSLRGSKYDVTAVVRPLLSRPYPVLGKDIDAARTYTNNIYINGQNVADSEIGYESGGKTSIYVAHMGKEGAEGTYLGATDYNGRGNVLGEAKGKYITLQPLEFQKVPRVTDFETANNGLRRRGTFKGHEGLTFHYTAIDLGGNKLSFEVYVPTRPNFAPQLDKWNWNDIENQEDAIAASTASGGWDAVAAGATYHSHGDVRGEKLGLHVRDVNSARTAADGSTGIFTEPMPKVWAWSQPSEGYQTSWGINWNSTQTGIDPKRFLLADRKYDFAASTNVTGTAVYDAAAQIEADPVYLMVCRQVNNYGGPTNPVSQPKPDAMHEVADGLWEITWKPNTYQGRKDYQYFIYGWDKYGAGMRPFPMAGKVFGTLTGDPINKYLYNNGSVLKTGPADLTVDGFARVGVNPFFDLSYPVENQIANHFGLDVDQPFLSINQPDTSAPWQVEVIPPNTPVMIAPARTSAGMGLAIKDPVFGPAVNSVDGTKAGKRYGSFDPSFGAASINAASYPTLLWETGNVFAYAYINPQAAEDPAAFENPAKRMPVDLSAYVGSGQLARLMDSSLDATDPSGMVDFYPTNLEVPKAWGTGGDFDYYGLMHGIGASGIIASGVVQVAMPSLGQSAFYHITEPTSAADTFPSEDYPSRLGWFNTLGTAKDYKTANLGLNFEPAILPIYSKDTDADYAKYVDWTTNTAAATTAANTYGEGLPYTFHIESGKANYTLLSLKKEDAFGTQSSPNANVRYPIWKVEKTGVPTRITSQSLLHFDNDFDENGGTTGIANMVGTFEPDGKADWHMLGTNETTDWELTHESDWADLTTTKLGTFKATINRGSFQSLLNTLSSRAASTTTSSVDRANVADTLQVVSYISGTGLGPVDNHQGLPVLLEFGDINHSVANYGAAGVSTAFTGTLNLGDIDINRPNQRAWHTSMDGDLSAPVASYIARYTDPATGLTGSMGLITDKIGDGIAMPSTFKPVSKVKITTGATNDDVAGAAEYASGTDMAATQNNRGAAVSTFISNFFSGTGSARLTSSGYGAVDASATTDVVDGAAGTVYVKAYNDQPSGLSQTAGVVNQDNYKVWLTWENPAQSSVSADWPSEKANEYLPTISGNIIEFYNAADFGAGKLNDSAVPIYKAYVGPSINKFPIPDAWLPYLGYQGGTNEFTPVAPATTTVVVRIRTVRYGDKDNLTFVNFDRTPYQQALPAVWADTLTAPLSFKNIGSNKVQVEAEGPYHGFKKSGQVFTGVAGEYDISVDDITADVDSTVASIAANSIVFSNTDGPILGDGAINWTVEYVDGSILSSAGVTHNDPSSDTADVTTAMLAALDTAGITGKYTGGVLSVNIPDPEWTAAQPALGSDYEDDRVDFTLQLLMKAEYTGGANSRFATKTITVNISKIFGIWGGFADNGTVSFTTAPTLTDGEDVADGDTNANIAGNAAIAMGPVVLNYPGLPEAPGAFTYLWEVEAAGAKLNGMGVNADTPVTATITGPSSTTLSPVLSITGANIQSAFTTGTGTWAPGGTLTITVPVKLTLEYDGNTGAETPRTHTWTGTFTYTIRSLTS